MCKFCEMKSDIIPFYNINVLHQELITEDEYGTQLNAGITADGRYYISADSMDGQALVYPKYCLVCGRQLQNNCWDFKGRIIEEN